MMDSKNYEILDHIPVIWEAPEQVENAILVIWLPGLSGKKEDVRSHLRLFADAGFIAVSFDAYEHGERMKESREAFREKLTSNKWRYFWPMIAMTAEEYPRVIDWAQKKFGLSNGVMAGGISMGGDIALVAAGLDRRILAAAASSPHRIGCGQARTNRPLIQTLMLGIVINDATL